MARKLLPGERAPTVTATQLLALRNQKLPCHVPGCTRNRRNGLGYTCSVHYDRQMRYGFPRVAA